MFGKPIATKDIIEKYRKGDELAKKAYQTLVDQMARCLASIVNILDPDAIVLGGGLSNVDELYQDLPKAMEPYIFSDSVQLNVLKAEYGDSSGIRGAAWLCSDEVK